MLGGLVLWGLVAILVVAAVAAAAAVLYFRFGMFRRRKGRGARKSGLLGESRIEVLERTQVDAERELVLVRCDRIEHLIMVGGPADLVVENDVKKVRGPGAAPTPVAAPADTGKRAAGALFEPLGPAAGRPAAERPAAARQSASAPASPHPDRSAAPAAATRPAAAAAAARPHDAREQRHRSSEGQPGRGGARRSTIQPTPLGGRSEPAREPQPPAMRGNGRQGGKAPSLPTAGVPWSEPDSIENEIVQALRVDPVSSGREPAAQRPAAAKGGGARSTTLGDLADRLEEALAEEVQSSAQSRRPGSDDDEFAFDLQPSGSAGARSSATRSAGSQHRSPSERKDDAPRRTPSAMSASPEPERRRESPGAEERREEAPVISLNARRRETADPLEDEMARLLGELTGDTKGR